MIIDERNNILKNYIDLIYHKNISFLHIPDSVKSSVHLVVVLLNNISLANYKKVFEEMRLRNIGVQLHYSPIHLQPYYRKLGFKEGDYPNSEEYSKRALSLPVFEGLEYEKQKYVVNNLLEIIDFLKN